MVFRLTVILLAVVAGALYILYRLFRPALQRIDEVCDQRDLVAEELQKQREQDAKLEAAAREAAIREIEELGPTPEDQECKQNKKFG